MIYRGVTRTSSPVDGLLLASVFFGGMYYLLRNRMAPPVRERRSGTVLIIDVMKPLARNPGSLQEVVNDALDRGEKKLLIALHRYAGCKGFQELIACSDIATRRGARLKFIDHDPRIGPGLDIFTQLIERFEFFETEAEAIESFTDGL